MFTEAEAVPGVQPREDGVKPLGSPAYLDGHPVIIVAAQHRVRDERTRIADPGRATPIMSGIAVTIPG